VLAAFTVSTIKGDESVYKMKRKKACGNNLPMAWKAFILALVAVMVFCGATGCDGNAADQSGGTREEYGLVDYSKEENWLSLPQKAAEPIDVFYLYPTSWVREEDEKADFCAIDDKRMLAGAKAHFASEATAFETVGNIYAPYYRQMDARLALSLSPLERDSLLEGIPAKDALAAFDYYIENLNDGRPFILAGDSQGSNVLMLILSGYMKENPHVYENMVAAYIIGYSVTEDYLAENSHVHFAEERSDTGVVISFNTEGPQIEGANPVLLAGALAINPISWERGQAIASEAQSLGSRVKEGDSYSDKRHFADAKIDTLRGTVICSTVNPDDFKVPSPIFGKGIYHTWDYGLYYYDIRQNAADRANSFLEMIEGK